MSFAGALLRKERMDVVPVANRDTDGRVLIGERDRSTWAEYRLVGPPRQATGPPRSSAGVGVGMLRGAGDSLT